MVLLTEPLIDCCCFHVIAEMMEESHFNSSYFWSPIPNVPGQVSLNKKSRLCSLFRIDVKKLFWGVFWVYKKRGSICESQIKNLSDRLRMPCSWTRWKSNRRRVFPSLLPLRPTTKQLFSPSPLLGQRQMEEDRLAVWHHSTLHTAPRTCCLSPPQASWQQVSLFLQIQASWYISVWDCSCLCHYTFNIISIHQTTISNLKNTKRSGWIKIPRV